MSGITDPSEEYFKDGLWAWVTNQWKKLIGDAAGHLQVDIVESGLPTGAATSANQTTIITALQLIDDLRAALNSVATDELDVVIDGQTTDVEIKQQTAGDLTPGIMGWDGLAWRKLPMVFGFTDQLLLRVLDQNAGAGITTILSAAVPAGEIWVATSLSATNATTDPSQLHVGIYNGSLYYRVDVFYTPGANVTISMQGVWLAVAGDKFYAEFRGCAAGDDLYLWIVGYKMKIAE